MNYFYCPFTGIVTKENLKVKPSKIVAGHEAERTNELLQAIGKAIDKKLSSTAAVTAVRNGTPTDNVSAPSKKSKSIAKPETPPTKPISKISSTSTAIKTNTTTAVRTSKSPLTKQRSGEKTSSLQEKENKVKLDQNGTKIKLKKTRENNSGSSKPRQTESIRAKDKVVEPVDVNAILPTTDETFSTKVLAEKPLSAEPRTDDPLGEEIKVEDTDIPFSSDNNSTLPTNGSPTKLNSNLTIENKEIDRKIPTSLSAELVDIIDQEAELRKKEKLEKKSARHKTRRKSSHDEEINLNANNQEGSTLHENIQPLKSIDDSSNMIKITTAAPLPGTGSIARNKSFILEDKGTNSRPRTSLRPPSVRPASARPGAPRRRDKNIEIILQPDETVKMAGIAIKVNSLNEELDDDGENLIIIEDSTVNQDSLMMNFGSKIGSTQKTEDSLSEGSAQQGHLVQQILETQKELSKIELGRDGEMDKKTELVSFEPNSKNYSNNVLFVFIYGFIFMHRTGMLQRCDNDNHRPNKWTY